MYKISVLGYGRLGSLIVQQLLKSKEVVKNLVVIEPDQRKWVNTSAIASLEFREDPAQNSDTAEFEVLIIAVKPQEASSTLLAYRNFRGIAISLMAGVDYASLQGFLPNSHMYRVVVNVAATIAMSLNYVYSAPPSNAQLHSKVTDVCVMNILNCLGTTHFVATEAQLDLTLIASSSGLACCLQFMDMYIQAVHQSGLELTQAKELMHRTMQAALSLGSLDTPQAWIEQIASPGGITKEMLKFMEENIDIHALIRVGLAKNSKLK